MVMQRHCQVMATTVNTVVWTPLRPLSWEIKEQKIHAKTKTKSHFFVQLSRKVFGWEGSEETAVSSLLKHDAIWDQFSTAASIFSHKVLNVQLSPSKRSLAKLGDKYELRGVYGFTLKLNFSPTQLLTKEVMH